MTQESGWLYSVDGNQSGPVSEDALGELLQDGQVPAGALVWTAGMPEWRPAAMVFPFQAAGGVVGDRPIPQVPYYPVTAAKFVVMSILTLGLYDVYWFYRNWRYVKDRYRLAISPFWRAVFVLIFCYELLKRVRDDAQSAGVSVTWSAGWLSAAYLGTNIIGSRLPDPLWMLAFLSVIPLLPVVATIQQMNQPGGDAWTAAGRFSGWDIAGCVVGGLFWLTVLSTYVLPQ